MMQPFMYQIIYYVFFHRSERIMETCKQKINKYIGTWDICGCSKWIWKPNHLNNSIMIQLIGCKVSLLAIHAFNLQSFTLFFNCQWYCGCARVTQNLHTSTPTYIYIHYVRMYEYAHLLRAFSYKKWDFPLTLSHINGNQQKRKWKATKSIIPNNKIKITKKRHNVKKLFVRILLVCV